MQRLSTFFTWLVCLVTLMALLAGCSPLKHAKTSISTALEHEHQSQAPAYGAR